MELNCTLPSAAEPDLAEADWTVPHVIACHSFLQAPTAIMPRRTAEADSWNFWLWHFSDMPPLAPHVRC